MIAFSRVSSILFLLAVFVCRTKTDTLRFTASDAEEEEKKQDIALVQNESVRSTISPEDDYPEKSFTEKDFISTDGGGDLLSSEPNFKEYDELRKAESKNGPSPENSVDRDSLGNMHSRAEETLETDSMTHSELSETHLENPEIDSANPLELVEKQSTVFEDTTNTALETGTDFSNFSCSFGDEKCKSLHSSLEESPDSKIKDKISPTTSSFTLSTTSLWSIVKSITPQEKASEELPDIYTPTDPITMIATAATSQVHTSENLILVEGSEINKEDSAMQNQSNKSEKSKTVKQDDSPGDVSEERMQRTFIKTSFTIPVTEISKESLSSFPVHPVSSMFLTKLFDITSTVTTAGSILYTELRNSSKSSISISETEYEEPRATKHYSKTSILEMSTPSTVPNSTASSELYGPFSNMFTPATWHKENSSFPSNDNKATEWYSEDVPELTPLLFSSFRESTITPETVVVESISPFSSVVTDISTPVTLISSLYPSTSAIQPDLIGRFPSKDTERTEEKVPPPRITNPGCSSLPVCVEITLLETTWEEYCSQVSEFQEFLSKAVSHYTRPIHPHQIVLDAEPCAERSSTRPLQNTPDVAVSFYVTDDSGEYEERLTEICGVILRKWAPTAFRNSILEVRQYNSDAHSTPIPVIPELNSGFVAAVSISAVAGVSLCLLCILLVVMKQKLLQGRNSPTSPTADAYSLDSLSINASFRRRRTRRSARSYLNHAFNDQEIPSHPLNDKTLANCLKNRELLEEEYKKIPLNMPKLDQIPEGAHVKNRYSNILPKPESRVVLAEPSGDPLKCYINANYVKGYEGKASFYIACQAPLPEGVEDFWRMIWEQQSRVIIMLTMFEENGISRCAAYFPQSTLVSHPPYGDFQISLLKKEVYEFYTKSTLRLLDLEKNLFRDIVHLWYTSWPEVGVPKDPSSLLTFVQQCRPLINCNSGPTIVHCSTGTGRTGVFLALDICMREYDESRSIDILQCVSQLRSDRGGAVQNKDQYILIYEAMLEYVSRMTNQAHRPSIRSSNS